MDSKEEVFVRRIGALIIAHLLGGCSASLDYREVLRADPTAEQRGLSQELAKLGPFTHRDVPLWISGERFYSDQNVALLMSYREPPEGIAAKSVVLIDPTDGDRVAIGDQHRPEELYEVVRRFHGFERSVPKIALEPASEQRVQDDLHSFYYVWQLTADLVASQRRHYLIGGDRRTEFCRLFDRYDGRLRDALRVGSPADFHRRCIPFLRFSADELLMLDREFQSPTSGDYRLRVEPTFIGHERAVRAALRVLECVSSRDFEEALLTRLTKSEQETLLLGLKAAQAARQATPTPADGSGSLADLFGEVLRLGFAAIHEQMALTNRHHSDWPRD